MTKTVLILLALLLPGLPALADTGPPQERAAAEKKWKPTDVKTCAFDVKRFRKMNPRLKWDTWPDRAETLYTILVPLLFVGALAALGMFSSLNRTSSAMAGPWPGLFFVVTALFVLWVLKAVGIRCSGYGIDYTVVLVLGSLAARWYRVSEIASKRKLADQTGCKFCSGCLEIIERVYVVCPRCGKGLD